MKITKVLPLFLLIVVLSASCKQYTHRMLRVKKSKHTVVSSETSGGLISKPKHYKFGNKNIGIENKDNYDNMDNSREDAHFLKNYASEEALYASKEEKIIVIPDQLKKENAINANLEKPYFIIGMVDDSCDNIILKDGTEISGIVKEISQTELRYKKCSNLDGPTFTINKSKVLMIQYRNGTKDIITNESVEVDSSVKEKKTIDEGKPLRVFGWIIWGVGLIVILTASIALGLLLAGLGILLTFVGRKK